MKGIFYSVIDLFLGLGLILAGITGLMQHNKISDLEQQVQALQKIDTSKLEQNKNFLQFCQENKLIFIVGEGQQREIFKTNILCK